MRPIFAVRWVFVLVILLPCSGVSLYATTIAFYSDGVIRAGDEYDRVDVYDTLPFHTTVDMTGGAIGRRGYLDTGVFTYDSSTVNMTGGYAYHLYTHDSSTVSISGGTVEDVYLMFETIVAAYDSSVINVYDGGFIAGAPDLAFFELFDSSELNVYGGTVGPCLFARNSASVNVYGGRLSNLVISGCSSVNIYGGYVDAFLANGSLPATATMDFYGFGFEYKAQGVWMPPLGEGEEGWWVSKLTGYGFDGNAITYIGLPDPALNPNIKFIPEPSTFLLCALGGLWLVRKRKTTRIVGREGGCDMPWRFAVRWVFVLVILLPCSGVRVYGTTIAFYSDGVIRPGDEYDRVDVYDTQPFHTTVDMTGGAIGRPGDLDTGVFTYDSSTVNMTGGGSYHLYTHDSSTVNISGAGVGDWDLDIFGGTSIAAYDSSTINLYDGSRLMGGTLTFFDLFDSSELNVYGGNVGLFLWAHSLATVNIYGGTLFDLWISDCSTVNVYGGFVSTFLENNPVPSTATVNFYGWGFEYKAEGGWEYLDDPADGWWVSSLTGYGFDGTPITYFGLPDPGLNPNIRFIPEPSTFLLCALGGLWLVRKRKTTRFVGRDGDTATALS